jgi:hypothetical protein
MVKTRLQLTALALAGTLSGSTIPAAAGEEDRSAAAVLDHHAMPSRPATSTPC